MNPAGPQGITSWHICISGFLQRADNLAGIQLLWRKLSVKFACHPEIQVEFYSWKENWKEKAERIWKFWEEEEPQVYVYCYSYGGGWGYRCLERELRKRGITVNHVVFCDAVWRGWFLGKILSFTGAFGYPRLKVRNALKYSWFYQRMSLPCGHPIVSAREGTENSPGVLIHSDHIHIDEHPLFQRECLKVSEECLTP